MAKFKALVSFSHMNNMYEPSMVEPYNHDDNELVRAWENAGYIEVLEDAVTPQAVPEPQAETPTEAPADEKKTEEQPQGVE